MLRAIIGTAALVLTGTAQAADFVIGDHFACTSRAGFDEAMKAVRANDAKWFASVPGCGFTNPGAKAVVLEPFVTEDLLPAAKVRVIQGQRSDIVWTMTDNLVPASK